MAKTLLAGFAMAGVGRNPEPAWLFGRSARTGSRKRCEGIVFHTFNNRDGCSLAWRLSGRLPRSTGLGTQRAMHRFRQPRAFSSSEETPHPVVASPRPLLGGITPPSSKIVIARHAQHLALDKRSGCSMGNPRRRREASSSYDCHTSKMIEGNGAAISEAPSRFRGWNKLKKKKRAG